MLQPIVQTSHFFKSTLLRSFVYRLKSKNLTCFSCRNFSNQRSKPGDDQNANLKDGQQPLSFSVAYKRLHFPLSTSLFKYDSVDPSEWLMVYRLKWSIKMIFLITYGHIVVSLAAITMLYKIFVEGKKYYHESIVDQPLYQRSLIFGCSLVIMLTVVVTRLFTQIVFRGYYSPKYQRYIFIKPSFFTPWQVRKLMVAPGVIEPLPSTFLRALQANYKIQNNRLFLFERNFFYPVYFNVLCGWSPPQSLANIKFNPDKQFKTGLK